MSANPRLLREALATLDDGKRWIKGQYHAPLPGGGGGFCVIGALNYAQSGMNFSDTEVTQEFVLLNGIAGEQHPELLLDAVTPVYALNDAKDTRWEDVRAILEKAIVRAEETFSDD